MIFFLVGASILTYYTYALFQKMEIEDSAFGLSFRKKDLRYYNDVVASGLTLVPLATLSITIDMIPLLS